MENLLSDDIIQQLNDVFVNLKHPISILFFGKQEACEHCEITQQLIQEVSALSDLIDVQLYGLESHPDLASKYNVDKAPGLVIVAREGDDLVDYGLRYAGAPAGHEFTSLIHDLLYVSKRQTDLNEDTRQFLQGLAEPVHLQVFVTPTCPYCPQAVLLAHQMAMESSLVQAEMVEATEFPDLSVQFHVSGVPQTTINAGAGTVVGAVPEPHLVTEIQKALGI